MKRSALSILRDDKAAMSRFAVGASKQRARRALERAQRELNERLQAAVSGPGADSFTAAQLQATLAQVRAVLGPLTRLMGADLMDLGGQAAATSARDTVNYVQAAEDEFGLGRPLPLDSARLIDQAVSGTNASLARRIAADPNHPGKPGVLARYGLATMGKFEESLQQRLIQGKPWDAVKADLVADSPFLQGAPASWAERLLRTEVMYASNKSGFESMKQVESTIGPMLKVLVATFDDRTGADSIAVHGQVRRTSEAFDSWFGPFMHPPNRPNDREVVVPHNQSWPLPPELKPRSDGEVAARWAAEGRKGSPPPRPLISTVDNIGQVPAAPLPQPTVPTAVPQPEAPMPMRLDLTIPAAPSVTYSIPAPAPVAPRPRSAEAYDMNFGRSEEGFSHFTKASAEVFTRVLEPEEMRRMLATDIDIDGATPSTRVQGFASEGRSSLAVNVVWKHPERGDIAAMERKYSTGDDGKPVVKHSLLVIEDESLRGKGFGSKIVAQQLESYQREGVSKVALEAAWDGSYVWARAGWHVSDPEAWKQVRERWAEHVDETVFDEKRAKALKRAKNIQQIALAEADGDLVGKDFLRGYYDTHSEVIPMELNVNSPEYAKAVAYFKSRSQ